MRIGSSPTDEHRATASRRRTPRGSDAALADVRRGYAAVVAVGTAYRLYSPPESAAPILYEDPLITALLLGPFAAAAAGASRGDGLALGLAVGVASALAYGVVLLGAALLSTGGASGLEEFGLVVAASALVGAVAGVLGAIVGSAVRG